MNISLQRTAKDQVVAIVIVPFELLDVQVGVCVGYKGEAVAASIKVCGVAAYLGAWL